MGEMSFFNRNFNISYSLAILFLYINILVIIENSFVEYHKTMKPVFCILVIDSIL